VHRTPSAGGFCAPLPWIATGLVEKRSWCLERLSSVLGISRSSAYECVRASSIPSIRLGRRIVVPRRAVDELLATAQATE